MTAPLAGARLDQLGEDPGEMALVGKAAILSDLGQRQRRVDEQVLRLLDPLLHQVLMGRHSDAFAEESGKVEQTGLSHVGQVGKPHIRVAVVIDVVQYAKEMSPGDPALRVRARQSHMTSSDAVPPSKCCTHSTAAGCNSAVATDVVRLENA